MRTSITNGKSASFLQFETLRYIRDHHQPLMRDVAHYFRITPPAATLLVDGLVREKLLARSFDAGDRRVVHLALTDAGHRYLSRGTNAHVKHLKKLFAVLSAHERIQLVGILEKISKSIKTA